jgi:peptidoglycan/xylan/chitin deacetylase (PgdA/CDA1 family)
MAADHTENYPAIESAPPLVRFYLGIKRLAFFLCKAAGLFHFARYLTRDQLRIICYHGYSISDESLFSPRTFINPDTFQKRMAYLAKKGFTVLDLEEALDLLDNGKLPPKAVVITIDDGFYSTYSCAWPIMKKYGFPATIYVTSYYAVKEQPIFGLAIQYMFWKTDKATIDTRGLGFHRSGPIAIGTSREKFQVAGEIIQFGESMAGEADRVKLSAAIGERLEVDYNQISESRILNIVNKEEIKILSEAGIDIQLHTHRHDLPNEKTAAVLEIRDNRAVLEPIVGKSLIHFCFPGGRWFEEQGAWLEEMGIKSAATCDSGLTTASANKLELKRFGDNEALSQVEFEAELFGFGELIRRLRGSQAG